MLPLQQPAASAALFARLQTRADASYQVLQQHGTSTDQQTAQWLQERLGHVVGGPGAVALLQQWATPQGQRLLGLIADDNLSGARRFIAEWAASESLKARDAGMLGVRMVYLAVSVFQKPPTASQCSGIVARLTSYGHLSAAQAARQLQHTPSCASVTVGHTGDATQRTRAYRSMAEQPLPVLSKGSATVAHAARQCNVPCMIVLCPLAIQPGAEPANDDGQRELDLQQRLDVEGLVALLLTPGGLAQVANRLRREYLADNMVFGEWGSPDDSRRGGRKGVRAATKELVRQQLSAAGVSEAGIADAVDWREDDGMFGAERRLILGMEAQQYDELVLSAISRQQADRGRTALRPYRQEREAAAAAVARAEANGERPAAGDVATLHRHRSDRARGVATQSGQVHIGVVASAAAAAGEAASGGDMAVAAESARLATAQQLADRRKLSTGQRAGALLTNAGGKGGQQRMGKENVHCGSGSRRAAGDGVEPVWRAFVVEHGKLLTTCVKETCARKTEGRVSLVLQPYEGVRYLGTRCNSKGAGGVVGAPAVAAAAAAPLHRGGRQLAVGVAIAAPRIAGAARAAAVGNTATPGPVAALVGGGSASGGGSTVSNGGGGNGDGGGGNGGGDGGIKRRDSSGGGGSKKPKGGSGSRQMLMTRFFV